MAPTVLLIIASVLCAVATPHLSAAAVVAPQLAVSQNPLLHPGPFAKWDQIKPEHIKPAVMQLIAEESASLDLLEQDLAQALQNNNITFDRVFLPYTQILLRIDAVAGQIDHLSSVMNTDALRAAVRQVAPDRVAFQLRLGQSKEIYNALVELNSTAMRTKLSPVQQRLVQLTLTSYKNSGVGLNAEMRQKFNGIVNRLQKLSTNYTNNILDATKAFEMLVTDKKLLAGLQPSTLAVAAQNAKEAGHKNATTENGPWLLTLDYGTFSSVVSFAEDRALRKKIWIAYRSLASGGKYDNTPYILAILKAQKELARMLGYANFAEQSFSGKMATFTQANKLLDQVTVDTRPAALSEDEQLTEFARKRTGNASLQLEWWDRSYWAERQKEQLYNYSEEELREYLPLNSVLKGLFQLANRLYGVDISQVTGAIPVWHKDVQVYKISNEGSPTPIAFFYLDPYSRPGQKTSGAWVQPFWDRAQYRRRASAAAVQAAKQGTLFHTNTAGKHNSSAAKSARLVQWSKALSDETFAWLRTAPMQVPFALIVTNQDPPADGKPSLMTMSTAHTLFHEFGHALQHMLTTAEYGLMSGMRSVEWDAVETPSQMQEKWVYDNKTFNSFARHWKTGRPVPASMFAKVKALVTYRAGNAFAYQLTLGKTDLQLYSSFDPSGTVTPMQVYKQNYNKYMPIPPHRDDMMLHNFGHIFTGGYSAGYYSYMWADVMSTDAFAAFLEAGTDNSTAVEQLGRRLRNTFLAAGGALSPAQVFRDFRGRDPEVQPLLKYNGLIN